MPAKDAYLAWKNDKNYLPSMPGHKMDYRRITALRLLLFFQTNMDFTVICGVIIWRWGGRVPLSCQLRVKSSHFIQIHLLHREMNGREEIRVQFSRLRSEQSLTVIYEVQPGELLCSHHMWLSSQETVKSCHRWLVTDDSWRLFAVITLVITMAEGEHWHSEPLSLPLSPMSGPSSLGFNGLIWHIHSPDRQLSTLCSCSGLSPANSGGILMAPTPGTMKWKLFLLEEHCIYLIFE